ncbi:HAD family hydrolase [Pandoraea eparura]
MIQSIPKRSTRIDAVLLDVYGTVCNVGERKRPFLKLAKLSRDPRMAIKMAMTRRMTIEDMATYVDASAITLEQVKRELQIELASISLFPDADTTLRCLRAGGIKIGLLSNLASPYAEPALDCLPIRPTACIWSFESGLLKPDSRIFELACEELAVDVRHTVMVGDSRACDYAGANSVGMRSVLLDRSGARHLGIDSINSLDLLLPIIHTTGKL